MCVLCFPHHRRFLFNLGRALGAWKSSCQVTPTMISNNSKHPPSQASMARMVRKTLRCFTNKSQWKIKIVLVLEHTIFKMLCFCYSDVNSEKKELVSPILLMLQEMLLVQTRDVFFSKTTHCRRRSWINYRSELVVVIPLTLNTDKVKVKRTSQVFPGCFIWKYPCSSWKHGKLRRLKLFDWDSELGHTSGSVKWIHKP